MFVFDLSQKCADDEEICQQVFDWTDSQRAANAADLLVGKPLALMGLLLLGVAVRWLLHRVVDRLVRRAAEGGINTKADRDARAARAGRFGLRRKAKLDWSTMDLNMASARRTQRAETLGSVFKSGITGVVAAIIATMMLSEIGVDIAPIIASAGIIGIALGFGAQSMVRDFLSGTFMIIEDQFGVGDVIDVGEATGVVEALTLRVTRLRSLDGTVWYVPNGEILRVGNKSQNWSRALVDVGVAYGQDLNHAQRVLREIAHDMWEDEDYRGIIIEEPEVTGVEELAADAVTLRVLIKTAPLEQWQVARELRARIKARFDTEGIEIPFAQRVVWLREEPETPSTETGGNAEEPN